jgi:serine/threonine protein kinase
MLSIRFVKLSTDVLSFPIFHNILQVLKRFRHPNIVALYGYNITWKETSQFLVYEFLVNGALSRFLMDDRGRIRLPGHIRISIMFQVARAVNFLHTGGCDNIKIFHRDIKSGNICLTQDFTAKLIDCGMSKFVSEGNNMLHEELVPATILKSSGAAVFGTLGYICPDYSQGDVPFTAACDVYSMGVVLVELIVGCLQGGQSSRNGKSFGNFSRRYVCDKYHEKVENGLEILINDADPAAEWNTVTVNLLCEIALQCLAPSPLRRPTTHNLVHRLGKISKIDFRGSVSSKDDPPEHIGYVPKGPSEDSTTTPCVLCHKTEVNSMKCFKMHSTCVSCLEEQIHVVIRRSGGDVRCGIVGCNSPFTDESLYGMISPSTYKEYVTQRGLQRVVDIRMKSLENKISKNHLETMKSLAEIKSVTDRSIKALAFLAKENGQKCPSLVWMVPAEPIVGRSARDWIKWAKGAINRRYHIYFVCQHSFAAVDVEPKLEIEVPRSWMVQAAPVLRLSLFAIKAAMSAIPVGPLPFPVPDILAKEQFSMYEQFTNSFLDAATTSLLELFESACTNGNDIPKTESSQLITLTGPAYDGIVEKAMKTKRLLWRQYMEIVVDRHGFPIWIKKEFLDFY